MQLSDKYRLALPCLLAASLLAACSDDNDDPATQASYRVTVTNLSAGQPVSPVGVVLHGDSHALWSLGQSASVALERLAEGGETQPWLDAAAADGAATAHGAGPIAPGAHEVLTITGDGDLHYLTVAGMLVNTNDGFSGVQGLRIADLQVGESLRQTARVYDAGTEDNTELASSFPGPASSGGEGFNAARDDRLDAVRVHAGVIGADDGLAGSALNAAHRFDNPGLRIEVERL